MNEQAQKVLIDLLNRALSGIDKAVEFSQAQIPDVVHQLLLWNFVESLLYFVIAILSVYPFVAFSKKQFHKVKLECDDGTYRRKYKCTMIFDSDGEVSPLSMVYCILAAIYVIMTMVAILDFTWLKIWLAPKLYLVEYAASLAK